MQNRSRLNIVLLFMAVALISWIIMRPAPLPEQKHTVSTVDIDSIGHIAVYNKHSAVIEFQRGSHWQISTPIKATANATRIRAMLAILHTQSDEQFTHDELASLEQLGLEQPDIYLQLDEHRFYFGSTDPINQRRYIKYKETIHLINDDLYLQLQQPAVFFVSRLLLPPDSEIQSLQLNGVEISRGLEQWLTKPLTVQTQEDISTLISSWQQAEALTVSKIQAQTSEQTITITMVAGSRIQFTLAHTETKIVLLRKALGLQYELSQSLAIRLHLLEPIDA